MASIVSNRNRDANSDSPAPVLQADNEGHSGKINRQSLIGYAGLGGRGNLVWTRDAWRERRATPSGKRGPKYVNGQELTPQNRRRAPDSEKCEQAVEHCGPPEKQVNPAYGKLHLAN